MHVTTLEPLELGCLTALDMRFVHLMHESAGEGGVEAVFALLLGRYVHPMHTVHRANRAAAACTSPAV